jgi:DNA-binding response OmpR family regulator
MPRVLVVDRSAAWCRYVADVLEAAGYRVDWTLDPDAALDRICDIAIVDTEIGTRRGSHLVAALRRRRPGLRAVIASSAVTGAHASEATLVGAFLVRKPLHPHALRDLVDACCREPG